jgi:hypothetical protein
METQKDLVEGSQIGRQADASTDRPESYFLLQTPTKDNGTR